MVSLLRTDMARLGWATYTWAPSRAGHCMLSDESPMCILFLSRSAWLNDMTHDDTKEPLGKEGGFRVGFVAELVPFSFLMTLALLSGNGLAPPPPLHLLSPSQPKDFFSMPRSDGETTPLPSQQTGGPVSDSNVSASSVYISLFSTRYSPS